LGIVILQSTGSAPHNIQLIIVFVGYLAAILFFACIYHSIYRRHKRSFLFNRDIEKMHRRLLRMLNRKTHVIVERKEESKRARLEAEVNLLRYCLAEIEIKKDPVPLEREAIREGFIITPKYRLHVDLESQKDLVNPNADDILSTSLTIYEGERIVARVTRDGHPNRFTNNLASQAEIIRVFIEDYETALKPEDSKIHRISSRDIWSFWDFLYFSTITQTTVGYGDILPNRTIVRVFVVLQILIGLSLIGIAINLIF